MRSFQKKQINKYNSNKPFTWRHQTNQSLRPTDAKRRPSHVSTSLTKVWDFISKKKTPCANCCGLLVCKIRVSNMATEIHSPKPHCKALLAVVLASTNVVVATCLYNSFFQSVSWSLDLKYYTVLFSGHARITFCRKSKEEKELLWIFYIRFDQMFA